METSFIIGFHTQRFDNLLQTLRFLTKDHREIVERSQLVTICQDIVDEKNISESRLDTLDGDAIPLFEQLGNSFKVWNHFDLNVECMQLPAITNFGIGKSKGDKLIVLESDRILPKGYFSDVFKQLEKGVQITCRNMLKLTKPTADRDIYENDFESKEEHRSDSNQIGMRNMWSGNTALMKADFYEAGKMDENYKGYGWADSDMTYQMESIGVKSIFRPELELHLWHEPMTYGDGDQKKMFLENGKRFLRKWKKEEPDWFKKEIADYNNKRLML